MFSYEEYLKPIQIKGLIQRFMKSKDSMNFNFMEELENNIISDALAEIEKNFEFTGTSQTLIPFISEQIMYVNFTKLDFKFIISTFFENIFHIF